MGGGGGGGVGAAAGRGGGEEGEGPPKRLSVVPGWASANWMRSSRSAPTSVAGIIMETEMSWMAGTFQAGHRVLRWAQNVQASPRTHHAYFR